MFYTGITHNANRILAEQRKNITKADSKTNESALIPMHSLTVSVCPTEARIECLKNIRELLDEDGVSGQCAELGVYQGDFAKEINRIFFDRRLYLFDMKFCFFYNNI